MYHPLNMCNYAMQKSHYLSKLIWQKRHYGLELKVWGFILSAGSADAVLKPSEVKLCFALCPEQDKKK